MKKRGICIAETILFRTLIFNSIDEVFHLGSRTQVCAHPRKTLIPKWALFVSKALTGGRRCLHPITECAGLCRR